MPLAGLLELLAQIRDGGLQAGLELSAVVHCACCGVWRQGKNGERRAVQAIGGPYCRFLSPQGCR